jgi:hypothetical protein
MFSSLIVSASPASEKPGPGNTGCRIPVDDLVLWADHEKNYDGNNKLKYADTSIVGALFTGQMLVYAPRVTFTDCIFSSTPNTSVSCLGANYNLQTYDNACSAMTVSYCTLKEAAGTNLYIDKGPTPADVGDPATSSLGANNRIEYCDIGYNCQDCAKIEKGTTFYKCWLHDAGNSAVKPDSHSDLIQGRFPQGALVVDQCNLDMKSVQFQTDKIGNPPDGDSICNCYKVPNKKANAAVIWKCSYNDGQDCSGDVTIKDNWINGGNYTLYHSMEQKCCDGGCGDSSTGTGSSIDCGNYYSDYTLTGNKIGRDYNFGLWAGDSNGSDPGNVTGSRTFTDNIFEDGMPIADGIENRPDRYYNRYNCFFADLWPGIDNECPGVDWPCSSPGPCTGAGCEECS